MTDGIFGTHADRWAAYGVGLAAMAQQTSESRGENWQGAEPVKDARYYLWKMTWVQAVALGALLVLTNLPIAFALGLALAVSSAVAGLECRKEQKSRIGSISGSIG